MSMIATEGLPFLKMHGLGNDFVVLDARRRPFALKPEAIAAIADRRSGIGFDQLAVIEPARGEDTDCFLSLFNADGSRTGACGNATRCVASLLFAESGKEAVAIETLAGILPAERLGELVRVDMGPARLDWQEIPLAASMDTLSLPLRLGGLAPPVAVGMGNPHAVFFVEDVEGLDIASIGPKVETDALFPERTNVEFAQVLSPKAIRMRVWERGTGITPACGSGACATLVAAARRGLTGRAADILLDGGTLSIAWRDDGHVLMTGPVALSFAGVLPASFSP